MSGFRLSCLARPVRPLLLATAAIASSAALLAAEPRSHYVLASPEWTGFYGGVNAGYGWGSENCRVVSVSGAGGGGAGGNAGGGGAGGNAGGGGAGGNAGGGGAGGGGASRITGCRGSDVSSGAAGGARGDLSGAFGGFQAGYNEQFDVFVLGFEGEFDWTGLEGAGAAINGVTLSSNVDWLASIGGRVGYLIERSSLVYAKGGAAFSDTAYGGDHAMLFGWFVGAGIEQILAPHITGKIEYEHFDFGSEAFTFTGVNGTSGTLDVDQRIDLIKAGLNYHF